jgi:protein-L-isoaspartate(D-aspartate) O-methyltransferase
VAITNLILDSHVGAAASETPQALIHQLKAPGRLFIPVGSTSQTIILIDKLEDGSVIKKKLMGVMVDCLYIDYF